MLVNIANNKKFIAAIVAGALAFAALLLLLLVNRGGLQQNRDFAVVYAKGSQSLWLAIAEGEFQLQASESRQQVIGGARGFLYYDAVTDDGLDLYVIALRDRNARQAGGRPVARNIGADWAVSANGRHVVYVERQGGKLIRYDAQQGAHENLADMVEALYAAQGQNVFFFTKREGGASVLFRCALGQRPERMTGSVTETHYFSNDTQAIVFYLAQTGDVTALYALQQHGGPQPIAENPEGILFEHYETGGNLYFFRRGEETQAASITLIDPYEAADTALQEPSQPPAPAARPGSGGRLTGILEGIFGSGGASGNDAYQRELQAWNQKLERDKVRAAAREAMQELPGGRAVMHCYAYTNNNVVRLAGGVAPEGVAALRPLGRAAVLFSKERASAAEIAKTVSIDALQGIYNGGGANAVREHLESLLGENAEPAGWALAMSTGRGVSEIPLDRSFGGGASWQAFFMNAPETLIYLESDVAGAAYGLYAYDLMDYGLSERRFIDTQVTDTAVGAVGMYYRRQEITGARGTLHFYHSGTNGERVLSNAGAFFFTPERMTLLALGNITQDSGTLNALINTKTQEIASSVKIDSVRAGANFTGWLANWSEGSGELWASDLNGPARRLDTGVTEIFMVY